MMSNFVELLYRQLSISCLWFLVKHDILIIVTENIYSPLIRKRNREIPKLSSRKERSFMAIRKKQEPSEYQKALRKFHKKSLPRLFTSKGKTTFWINRWDVCWGADFISCQSVRSHIRYIHSKEIIPANVSSDRRYKGSKRLVFLLLTVLYW